MVHPVGHPVRLQVSDTGAWLRGAERVTCGSPAEWPAMQAALDRLRADPERVSVGEFTVGGLAPGLPMEVLEEGLGRIRASEGLLERRTAGPGVPAGAGVVAGDTSGVGVVAPPWTSRPAERVVLRVIPLPVNLTQGAARGQVASSSVTGAWSETAQPSGVTNARAVGKAALASR